MYLALIYLITISPNQLNQSLISILHLQISHLNLIRSLIGAIGANRQKK